MYSSIHLSVFNFCVLSYSKIHYMYIGVHIAQSFLQHQFYYNQVTATDTRNLLEYYLKPFKQSI
jgi:hypothetical protein